MQTISGNSEKAPTLTFTLKDSCNEEGPGKLRQTTSMHALLDRISFFYAHPVRDVQVDQIGSTSQTLVRFAAQNGSVQREILRGPTAVQAGRGVANHPVLGRARIRKNGVRSPIASHLRACVRGNRPQSLSDAAWFVSGIHTGPEGTTLLADH